MLIPRLLITPDRTAKKQLVLFCQMGLTQLQDALHSSRYRVVGNLFFAGRVLPRTQGKEVVRSPRLERGADARLFPPAEGLAANNSAGDTAVDVGVSCFYVLKPIAHFGRVERVNARGEPIVDRVLHAHGLLKRRRSHNS